MLFRFFPLYVENFLRLFVDGLYFILLLCFQRERVFAARLCRFQIARDPLSSFFQYFTRRIKEEIRHYKEQDKNIDSRDHNVVDPLRVKIY